MLCDLMCEGEEIRGLAVMRVVRVCTWENRVSCLYFVLGYAVIVCLCLPAYEGNVYSQFDFLPGVQPCLLLPINKYGNSGIKNKTEALPFHKERGGDP